MLRLYWLAICFAVVAGCGNNSVSNVEFGNKNQILFYGNGSEPKSVDPQLTTGSPESNIILALFEGLVRKDHASLEPKPAVAESWTVSEDGLTYRFNLRKNAAWSNGDPLTAEDFVLSWQRALTPALPNEYAYMMFIIQNAEAYNKGTLTDFAKVGVKAVETHLLEITLNSPVQYFLQLLDHHSYYPVHLPTIKKFGEIHDSSSKWILPGNFVGNGPFVLKSWELNKSLVVTKSETYWDKDKILLNGVHFLPIEDKQGEERAFRSGVIHLTNTPQLDIEKIATYKKNHPEQLRVIPAYSSYYYEFNVTRVPFDDVRVRRAFALAVDRDTLVNRVTKGGEVASYNFVPAAPGGYEPKDYVKHDVAAAQKLLAEAGYPNGEGFPEVSLLYNTDDNHRKVALTVQQMLDNNLNVKIQIENKEWKVYIDAKKNLHHDFARAGWIADYMDPSNFFDILRSGVGNNNTGWSNPAYDRIMDQIEKESDPKKRNALFEQANQLLSEEMPVLPLYYYSDINLVSTHVQNWFDNAMHFHPFKGVYLK